MQVLPGFFLGLPDQAEAVVGGREVLVTGEDAGVPPLCLGHLAACQERVGVLDKLVRGNDGLRLLSAEVLDRRVQSGGIECGSTHVSSLRDVHLPQPLQVEAEVVEDARIVRLLARSCLELVQ